MKSVSTVLDKVLQRQRLQGPGVSKRALSFTAWSMRASLKGENKSKYWSDWRALYDFYCKYFRDFLFFADSTARAYGGYGNGLPNGTAASLESLIVFANLVGDRNSVILNCGAGASSFVLRKMFRNVVCCDPDPTYLNYVRETCKAGGLSGDNFITDLQNSPDADFVFYDYGELGLREQYLPMALNKTKTLLYADDSDDREIMRWYRESIYKFARANRLRIEDCREAKDKYGRWGVVIRTSAPDAQSGVAL